MIKRLQYKFILVTMVALIIVMTIVVAGINLVSNYRYNYEADQFLQILSENDGQLPPLESIDMPLHGLFGLPFRITQETLYEMRYLFIKVDRLGTITQVNIDKTIPVTSYEAIKMAKQILTTSSKKGYIEDFRYLVSDQGSGNMLLFLDCTNSLARQKSLLGISTIVGIISIILVLVIVAAFSKQVIRPFVENAEMQKRFITDAGHELKTPLAIIAVNTEVMEMQAGKNEWTDAIHHQISRLDDLIRRLLSLSRLNEQQLAEQNLININISEMAQNIIDEFKILIESRGKSLTWEIDNDLHIRGEASSIEQLLSILIDNAISHSTENGQILFSLKSEQEQIKCQISNACDTFDVYSINRLFDRFYRVDSSRARSSGGFGIGLSIARTIVENHKGKITVDSADNHSIVFKVLLPAISHNL